MTTYDYIMYDPEFKTFYYYFDDFEFGGWQTSSNPAEADSFDSPEEARHECKEPGAVPVKRHIIIEV